MSYRVCPHPSCIALRHARYLLVDADYTIVHLLQTFVRGNISRSVSYFLATCPLARGSDPAGILLCRCRALVAQELLSICDVSRRSAALSPASSNASGPIANEKGTFAQGRVGE